MNMIDAKGKQDTKKKHFLALPSEKTEKQVYEKMKGVLKRKKINLYKYDYPSSINTLSDKRNLFINKDLTIERKIYFCVLALLVFEEEINIYEKGGIKE